MAEETVGSARQQDLRTLAQVVDEAAAEARDWRDIARGLRERVPGDESDTARWIRAAFDYELKFASEAGEPAFVPMLGWTSGETYPPSGCNVPGEAIILWGELLSLVADPLNQARLAHLLVEFGSSNRYQLAQIAASAYLECARRLEEEHDQFQALSSANRLSRTFNFEDTRQKVEDALVELAEKCLRSDDRKPGIFIGALKLVEDSENEHVDEVLATAREACRGDAWNLQAVLAVARRRAKNDSATQRALDEERVRAWLRQADQSEPMARLIHLETAARLALDLGLAELAGEARKALQEVNPDELGLREIESKVEIPREDIEQYLSRYTDHPRWEDALTYFAVSPPPTGSVKANRAAVERAREEFPLQALFPKTVLGGDGLPRYRPATEDEEFEAALADHEMLRLQVETQLLGSAFWRIWIRFGIPSDEELTTFLVNILAFDAEDAATLVYSFSRLRDEDHLAATYVLTALVERLARKLAMRGDRGVYRVQRANQPGQYPGLGALLRQLRDMGLSESWYRFYWTFLASPSGANFRNELFHGFVTTVSSGHALLLLKAALHLGVLTLAATDAPDTPAAAARVD